MKQIISVLILMCGYVCTYSQQTMQEIENDLKQSYQQILKHRYEHEYEKVEASNKVFMHKLLAYTSNSPRTLSYPFDSLKAENIDIVTSDDGLLRIYSWDTWTGGTMHDFCTILQYKANDIVYAKVNYDTTGTESYTPYYTELCTFKANGKTYYLAVGNGIYSSKDYGQSIEAFTIEDGLVQNVAIFKQEDKLVKAIDVYFDFISIMDINDRPLQLIKFDGKNGTVLIPEIDSGEQFTNKYKRYKYNGRYFEAAGR